MLKDIRALESTIIDRYPGPLVSDDDGHEFSFGEQYVDHYDKYHLTVKIPLDFDYCTMVHPYRVKCPQKDYNDIFLVYYKKI